MNKLKNHIIYILSFVTSIVAYFIPNFDVMYKSLIFLIAIVFSLLSYIYQLNKMFSKLQKDYDDVKQKHKALSSQFTEKQAIIKQYENAYSTTQQILGVALSNTKETKLNEVAKSINLQFTQINSGGLYHVQEKQSNQNN